MVVFRYRHSKGGFAVWDKKTWSFERAKGFGKRPLRFIPLDMMDRYVSRFYVKNNPNLEMDFSLTTTSDGCILKRPPLCSRINQL